jgi:hypothetical protein
MVAEIEAFVRKGSATGALLDAEDDRWEGQSLLDYWSAMLYRAGFEPPDASLAEFNPDLAPDIPDSLCPYVGLDAFGEDSRNFFYGRGRLVQEMENVLAQSRFLSVVGASGSGKSSVVRAGLLTELKAGALMGSKGWHYYPPMVPGSDPLSTLIRLVQPPDVESEQSIEWHIDRLRNDAGHLCQVISDLNEMPAVIVIDQLEEIFTLCTDNVVRKAFVDNLVCLAKTEGERHTVIVTIRTDFESQVARLPVFQELFSQSQVRVTAMSASELRAAIEEPAARVGLKFEDGVVESLLRDILGEPAALPLLQFTLLKLWEAREHNRVTWEAYMRLGGGRQALARSADEFYESLIPEEQVTAKRILLRMVRPGEGLEVTSNRVRREVLYEAGEARDRVDRVLDRLINEARLVRLTEGNSPTDTQVEVAHEALVRNWPRLVDWLDEERESMRRRLRLTAAAEQWETTGRDPEALLRGTLLQEALRYEDLSAVEVAFVQASQEAVEAARRREEEARQKELEQARALAEEQQARAEAEYARAEAQGRAARRARMLLVTLGIVFVLALAAGGLMVQRAQQNAELEAVAAAADAAETRLAAESALVAARNAEATAVAKLATSEAQGGGSEDEAAAAELATAQAMAEEASVVQATAQAAQLTAVAARQAAQATATSTPMPSPTATHTPEPPPPLPALAAVTEAAAVFAAPASDAARLGFVAPGDEVQVLGRAENEGWFYVRAAGVAEGFVWGEFLAWEGEMTALPVVYPTVTAQVAATPAPVRVFALEYRGCQSHSFGMGSVKGQVFDASGSVIEGALVEIWINGAPWDSTANPARTNQDGWYEWVLSLDQMIRFVRLTVDGQEVPFRPVGFEVVTESGCFHQIDFLE